MIYFFVIKMVIMEIIRVYIILHGINFFENGLSLIINIIERLLVGFFITILEHWLYMFRFGLVTHTNSLLGSLFNEFFLLFEFHILIHVLEFFHFSSLALTLLDFVIQFALNLGDSLILDLLLEQEHFLFVHFI